MGGHHATTVGKLFRPDNPLLPHYKWVPIGRHGCASSIVVSEASIRRPLGQTKGANDTPLVGPSQRLDYELELGFLIGTGNALGEPIAIEEAEQHLFGVALFNDWSVRDTQPWNTPLCREPRQHAVAVGGDAGGTGAVPRAALSIGRRPWVIRPKTRAGRTRHRTRGPAAYRGGASQGAVRLTRGNAREAAYWTPAQLVAHRTSGGCNLQPGDLFVSGTLSGTGPDQAGSLLELTQGGK